MHIYNSRPPAAPRTPVTLEGAIGKAEAANATLRVAKACKNYSWLNAEKNADHQETHTLKFFDTVRTAAPLLCTTRRMAAAGAGALVESYTTQQQPHCSCV